MWNCVGSLESIRSREAEKNGIISLDADYGSNRLGLASNKLVSLSLSLVRCILKSIISVFRTDVILIAGSPVFIIGVVQAQKI